MGTDLNEMALMTELRDGLKLLFWYLCKMDYDSTMEADTFFCLTLSGLARASRMSYRC